MHHQIYCFLAQGQAAPALPELPERSMFQQFYANREFMLVLGIAVVATVGLLAWACLIRKRRPSDPHLRALEPGAIKFEEESPSEEHHHHHHRRRRHRRRHRQGSHGHRNPTLQETGGLPPLRQEGEPPQA
jgi:hypothetical protein